MNLMISIFFLAASLLPIDVVASNIPTPQPTTFTAKVSNVRLSGHLTAQGKKHTDIISVSTPAIMFAQPIEIVDVRTASASSIPEVDVLVRYLKANIQGDAQEILSFWLPEERAAKSKQLSDPKLFQANREYLSRNPGLSIVGLVFQDQTVSVLIRRHKSVKGMIFAKKDGRIFLTDHASNDLELAIIEASFFPD